MRRFCAVLLLILPLAGCHLLGLAGPAQRPELIVHGRPLRAAILNPEPPLYGDGNPGGCIVLSEFRVVITELSRDGAGTLRIRGSVAGPPGLPLVTARIAYVRGDSTAAAVHSGSGGEFSIIAEPGDNAKLVVSQVMFRSLELDLRRLARAARTSGAS